MTSSNPQASLTKVCLVRPASLTTVGNVTQDGVMPIGLAYIAGALTRHQYDVTVIDAVGEAPQKYSRVADGAHLLVHGLSPEEIIARVPADVSVIGVTTMFSIEWLSNREVIRALRKKFPSALIVLGGEHASAVPDFILQSTPEVDVIVKGEGEETIISLIEAHRLGQSFSSVAGISFRENGEIRSNPARPRIKAIDEIAEPRWDLFPVKNYHEHAISHGLRLGLSMPLLASRGCPYRCTFCSSPQMWTTAWKARDPKAVIAEIKKYQAEYGAETFTLCDLTAIIKKDWILKFCHLLIEENLQITWQFPTGSRSEAVDEEVAQAMYRAGCRLMDYAPESGSPSELKRIKKNVNLARMLDSLSAARQAGFEGKVNFILGLPDTTWRDFLNTLVFIFKVALRGATDISASTFAPYPGSELFQKLVEKGTLKLDEKYFSDLQAALDHLNVSYSTIHARLLPLLNLFVMGYFYSLNFLFRPARLIRLVRDCRSGKHTTRLGNVLTNLKRKRLALETSNRLGLDSVTLPA